MKRRRVKITGIGPVTPAGIGREEFWKGLLEPVSRVRSYKKLGAEFGEFSAATIEGFNVANYIDRTQLPKGAARQTLFGVACALLALRDAKVSPQQLQKANTAVVLGSSLMDFGSIGGGIEAVNKRGPNGAQPRTLFVMGVSCVASAVTDVLGLDAQVISVSKQCCAGLDAVGMGADLIATGQADMVLCGGAESPLHRFPLLELRTAELTPATDQMPDRISRPFDLWRTTGVVSEGACVMLLEPEESPRAHYSYVAGHSFVNDTGGDLCGGMATGGRLALASAGLRPSDVDAICAWAPGHKLVDAGEARAMRRLFGEHLQNIPVVAPSGAIGNSLGAAGPIHVAASAMAQSYGIIPGTVNWTHADPDCALNLSSQCRYVPHGVTLINAHGAGGVNATLVLRR